MVGYLIYGSVDGFGNDVYVVGNKVYTDFKEACREADEWNADDGVKEVLFYDKKISLHEYYKLMQKEDIRDINSVRCYTPVQIKIV